MSRAQLSEHASAMDALDFDVREEVRRRGVDPLTDVESVRRFARSAVRSHDQRSLSGVVRPVPNPDEVVDELVARVAGFGPLQRYLDDPRCTFEVWSGTLYQVRTSKPTKRCPGFMNLSDATASIQALSDSLWQRKSRGDRTLTSSPAMKSSSPDRC